MAEPLNPDAEIQAEIDQTIAAMRRVEANYVAHLAALRAKKTATMDEEVARFFVEGTLRKEWWEARRPYVARVQQLAASHRRDGVIYISPLSPELAGRVGQALA